MLNLPDGVEWPVPDEAVLEIATSEQGPRGGPALKAYRCPAGVWTLGFGETDGVKPDSVCTEVQAWEMLRTDLHKRAAAVRAMCTREPGPCEMGAMLSLSYNIGLDALRKSSVLKAHNRGATQAAAQAFLLYDKARVNGALVVLAGLKSRRHREAALYLKDAPEEAGMPQAVAPAPSMAASPTVQTGTVVTVTGAIAMVSQAGDQVTSVSSTIKATKELATETLGIPDGWFLPVVMVLGGAYVVWRRFGQRAQGLA